MFLAENFSVFCVSNRFLRKFRRNLALKQRRERENKKAKKAKGKMLKEVNDQVSIKLGDH